MALPEQAVKRLIIGLVALFCKRPPVPISEIPAAAWRRILVVRQHDQLGDLLLATPAIRGLRRRFPSAHIAVVVREYTEPMIRNNPHVDEVILFYEKLSRWNLKRMRRFLAALRRPGFDTAILLNTISRSLSSDLIALVSGARFIIGPDEPALAGGAGEGIYNVLVHRNRGAEHEIERNVSILRPFGVDENNQDYDLVLTEEEKEEADRLFAGVDGTGPVVGVHFGAADQTRCFPLDKLAAVVDSMKREYECTVVLFSGPKETERRSYLLRTIRAAVVTSPVLPLRVAAAYMRNFDLLLCNDTGTLHIAAALGVPTVSFHALNDPAVWKPPQERHVAVRAADALITSISVDDARNGIAKAWPFVLKHRQENSGRRKGGA